MVCKKSGQKKSWIPVSFILGWMFLSCLQASPPGPKSLTSLKVLTTIKPIQALTHVVMQGIGTPQLLLEGTADPHHFSLSPSHIKMIKEADLILWIGPSLEDFLVKSLMGNQKKTLTLIATEGLRLLHRKNSEGCLLEEACVKPHPHDQHDGVDVEYTAIDPHIWFDVDNVALLVQEIAYQLSALDLENAALYDANAKAFVVKLQAFKKEQSATGKALGHFHFIAFHDAFAYLEQSLSLINNAPQALQGEENPSLKSFGDLKTLIKQKNIRCLVVDASHQGAVEEKLAKELGMITVKVDTLGASIPVGPDHYFLMMRGVMEHFQGCQKTSLKAAHHSPKKGGA